MERIMDNPIQNDPVFNSVLPEIILFTFAPLWAGIDNLVLFLEALKTGPTFLGFLIRRIAIHAGQRFQVNLIAHGSVKLHRLAQTRLIGNEPPRPPFLD
jgi:hypothetical protein